MRKKKKKSVFQILFHFEHAKATTGLGHQWMEIIYASPKKWLWLKDGIPQLHFIPFQIFYSCTENVLQNQTALLPSELFSFEYPPRLKFQCKWLGLRSAPILISGPLFFPPVGYTYPMPSWPAVSVWQYGGWYGRNMYSYMGNGPRAVLRGFAGREKRHGELCKGLRRHW